MDREARALAVERRSRDEFGNHPAVVAYIARVMSWISTATGDATLAGTVAAIEFRLRLRTELNFSPEASDEVVADRLDHMFRYLLTQASCRINGRYHNPDEVMRIEDPGLMVILEAWCGPMPTLFPGGNFSAITRSGFLRGEPAWAPIEPMCTHIFGLSGSFIRRLARDGKIDNFRLRPRGRQMIRVQSLRDYCDRKAK